MVEFIVGLVGDWIGGRFGGNATEMSMRKARAQAYEGGRDVFFPGVVVGDVPYASPAGGSWLVLSEGELSWSAAEGFGRPLWTQVPTAKLRLLSERSPRRDVESTIRSDWVVFECRDRDSPVLIACAADDGRYVQAAAWG